MSPTADDLAPLRQCLAELLAACRKSAGLTQQDVADRVGYARVTVACAETGHRVPAEAFWEKCDYLLGAAGQLNRAYAQLTAARRERARRNARDKQAEREGQIMLQHPVQGGAGAAIDRPPASADEGARAAGLTQPAVVWDGPAGLDDRGMRRRSFVGLAGAGLLSPVLASVPGGEAADGVTGAMLGYRLLTSMGRNDVPGMSQLRHGLQAAKRAYQAATYARASRMLPDLLTGLDAASSASQGDYRLAVWELAAQAYHVAASVQLKAGNEGPAWLAADRSMQAAERSERPVMLASSARIMVHALAASGRAGQAAVFARSAAARLPIGGPGSDGAELSVYGSLLLRGAVAAARAGDRATAAELLDEAGDAGRRLGGDHNHAWTGFGPTNVLLHRTHVAVVLGDAGMAIDLARAIDPAGVVLTERRVCLLLDVARAWAQLRKYDRACRTLLAAYETAPEELTGRLSVQALVTETLLNAPPSVRPYARDLARLVGAE
jgi:transcriptional regulator with XRE-family HTH domain